MNIEQYTNIPSSELAKKIRQVDCPFALVLQPDSSFTQKNPSVEEICNAIVDSKCCFHAVHGMQFDWFLDRVQFSLVLKGILSKMESRHIFTMTFESGESTQDILEFMKTVTGLPIEL